MKIAIDAMGGDYAPAEIVKGAVQAVALYHVDVVLVGDEKAIRKSLPRSGPEAKRIQVRHTDEAIQMNDPASSFRTRKDASVCLCADMVRERHADAMVSAGNTGAAMAVATFKLGRIEGIERPAIAAEFPALTGRTILLDAGANADCEVSNLIQFALMGSVYAEKVMGVTNPRVALLSIGEEECKGNELTKQAHSVLRESKLNFIGNVEGRHLFMGAADVIVCDGFTGNVALKSVEGLAEYVLAVIERDRKTLLARIRGAVFRPALMRLKRRIDYAEHGGAPLLGVNGVCVISHGRSDARAISSAIKAAIRAVEQDVVSSIAASLENIASTSAKVV